MFIAIEHDIHDPESFQKCAQDVFPLPDGFHVHQFFPAVDTSRAVCLYEAPSVDQLSEYLDATLGNSSDQQYFPVSEENGIGLPRSVMESTAV